MVREPSNRPRVVVVGAGFGGLTAVRALHRQPVDIVLVDRRNFHTFTPLLYQVASALLDPAEIAHSIRSILRPLRKCDVRLAEATGVDFDAHRVRTSEGDITYDYLVLAAGSVTNYFRIERLAEQSFGLKSLEEAMGLRNRILASFEQAAWESDPERRRRLLSFVVVGGGPTGVEFSGALAELIRHVMRRDFRRLDTREARIVLIEAGPQLLPAFVPALREDARRQLERHGVEVVLNRAVEAVSDTRLTFKDGSAMDAGTVIWTAGVAANPIGERLGVELGRARTVKVRRTLQLPGHPDVFVIGDMAGLEEGGQPLPMLIPVAMQEARHVAENISRLRRGDGAVPFRYRDPGIMATIGRNAGIAQIGFLKIDGRLGWFLWLGFHLLQIVSLRSKVVVLLNWAWNYFFWDRPIRLLVRADADDDPGPRAGQAPPLRVDHREQS